MNLNALINIKNCTEKWFSRQDVVNDKYVLETKAHCVRDKNKSKRSF